MPVIGLPHTLEMLLSSLTGDNALKSWQIYDEKSGEITVKIRFGNQHVIHDKPECMRTASFQQKSTSRLTRDRNRAITFRQCRTMNRTQNNRCTAASTSSSRPTLSDRTLGVNPVQRNGAVTRSMSNRNKSDTPIEHSRQHANISGTTADMDISPIPESVDRGDDNSQLNVFHESESLNQTCPNIPESDPVIPDPEGGGDCECAAMAIPDGVGQCGEVCDEAAVQSLHAPLDIDAMVENICDKMEILFANFLVSKQPD